MDDAYSTEHGVDLMARMWRCIRVALALLVACVGAAEAVQFGAGTGSSYPATLDTVNTRTNEGGGSCSSTDTTLLCSEFSNDVQGAVRAIQVELGVLPKGSYADVKTRLNAALYSGGALGTPSSGTATNLTGLPLTTGVTGDLPYANLVQATAASKLLGRGSAAGAGDWEEVTLGTNLSMSGSTLNASGSGEDWTLNKTISNTAPSLVLTDTTASAKSLTIAVDANLAQLRESAGASGSLLVLDLAQNRVGIGVSSPAAILDVASEIIGSQVKLSGFSGSSGTAANHNLAFLSARGTVAAPSASQTDDWLGWVNFRGYGATGFASTARSSMGAKAEENWTDSANGSYLVFSTTATGGTTLSEKMRITGAGNVGIGTTPTTLLDLLGADSTTVQTIKINATQANITTADTFIDFRSTTGSEGSIAGTAVAGVIAYNTFTGSHYTQVEDADRPSLQVGMLLEATGDAMTPLGKKTRTRTIPEKRQVDEKDGKETITPAQDIEETFEASHKPYLVKSRIARTKGSKAAYGVYGGTDKEGRDLVLALGTGLCYVTKTARAIAVGDYLMASDVPGTMEVQADDIYRNSTVAKAMTKVVWTVGQTSKQIPCIYLGG